MLERSQSLIRNFLPAMAISIFVHILLMCCVCTVIRVTDEDAQTVVDELPQLDVTSVDLSFSDEESDAEPPSVSQPGAPEMKPFEPQFSQPEFPEPPPLTVSQDDATVLIKAFEEVRVTDLKPSEPIVPDMVVNEEREVDENIQDAQNEQQQFDEQQQFAQNDAAAVPAPQQACLDAPPAPRRTIKPKYPDGARRRGEQGDVTLELEVDVHGVVIGVKVVAGCGFAELEQAAVAAVRKAMFRPARHNDKPVRSRARLTLQFQLRER